MDDILLKQYVETANNPAYKGDWNVIYSKFPEFKDVDKNVLKQYVETANNPSYKSDFSVINSKFPEFFQGSGVTAPKQPSYAFTPEIQQGINIGNGASVTDAQGNISTPNPRQGTIDSTAINAPVIEIPSNELPSSEIPKGDMYYTPTIPTEGKNLQLTPEQQDKIALNLTGSIPERTQKRQQTDSEFRSEFEAQHPIRQSIADVITGINTGASTATKGVQSSIYNAIGDTFNSDWLKDRSKYLDKEIKSENEELPKTKSASVGSAIGSAVPFMGMAVADGLTGGALTPAIIGTFAVSGYGDGIKEYDRIKSENNEESNPAARVATGLGYGTVMAGATALLGNMGVKWLGKGVSSLIGAASKTALETAPKIESELISKGISNYISKTPSLLKTFGKGMASSIGTMEGMEIGKMGINFAAGEDITAQNAFDKVKTAAAQGVIFSFISPFSAYSANKETYNRRMESGEVTIGTDGKQSVELITDKAGNQKGITPDGKMIDVNQSMIDNSITMTAKDFYAKMGEFKQNKTVDINERDIYSNRLQQQLSKLADQNTGNITVATDADGNKNYLYGSDKEGNIIGVNGQGETSVIGKVVEGRGVYNEGITLENANAVDIHKSIMNEWDKIKSNPTPKVSEQPSIETTDPIQSEKDKAAELLNQSVNVTNRTIQEIELETGEKGIVNGGEIKYNEDGTIDRKSEGIISFKEITGLDEQGNPIYSEPKVINPNLIKTVGEAKPIEQAKTEADQQIDQIAQQQQAEFYPTDVESYENNGNPVQVSYNPETNQFFAQQIELNGDNAFLVDEPMEITPEQYAQISGKQIPIKTIENTPQNEPMQPTSADNLINNPQTNENGLQENTTEKVSYPTKKDGSIDFEAMTDEQVINYTRETEGEESAIALAERQVKRLQGQIAENQRATAKHAEETNKLLAKSKTMQEDRAITAKQTAKGIALSEEYTTLITKLGEFKAYLPKEEVAPVAETQTPAPKLRPEIAQLQKEEAERTAKEQELVDKKADIERRRNEELFQHGEGELAKDHEYIDDEKAAIIKQKMSDIREADGSVSDENLEEFRNLRKELNDLSFHVLLPSAIRDINAKYDAELAALDQTAPLPEEIAPVINETSEIKPTETEINNENVETLEPKQPKTTTPFQQRQNNLGDYVDMEDYILRAIAGGLKFKWKTDGVKKGMADELGFADNVGERRGYLNLIDEKNGITPQDFAHNIWNEYGEDGNSGEIPGVRNMTDHDILNLVHDVLRATKSNTAALEQAEAKRNNFELTPEDYGVYDSFTPEEINYLEQIPDDILESYLGITNFTPEQIDFINQLHTDYGKTNAEPAGTSPSERNQGPESETTEPRTTEELSSLIDELAYKSKNADEFRKNLAIEMFDIPTNDSASIIGLSPSISTEENIAILNSYYKEAKKRHAKLVAERKQEADNARAEQNVNNITDLAMSQIADMDKLIAEHDTAELDNYIAEQDHNTNPTEKQKETGIYPKARVNLQHHNITIETLKGTERSGIDEGGQKWSVTMQNHYGELDGTIGYDNDPIDVFIGNNPKQGQIFVVDQISPDGSFDESKVMLGFDSVEEAKAAYMSNYSEGWDGFKSITPAGDNFKEWLYDGKKQKKPFAEYKDTPEPHQQLSEIPLKNGSTVTYQGKQYTVNGIDTDGKSIDLYEGGKMIHEDIPVEDVNHIVDTNEMVNPIGKGVFGNIYDQFKGKAKEAIDFLTGKRDGEAIGALHHTSVGDIDLVWGKEGTSQSDGFGLAKILKYHPEVATDLQGILDDMHEVERTENRVQLESEKYKAAVRLEWDGEAKTWLLTAFEKIPESTDRTTDITSNQNDLKNDTAPLQNSGISDSKDTALDSENQTSSVKSETEEENIQTKQDEQDQVLDELTAGEATVQHEDFGEKIGGAKKDMGITRTLRESDSMPSWRRKYNFSGLGNVMEIGKPVDTTQPFRLTYGIKGKDWRGKETTHYKPVTEIENGYRTYKDKVFTSEQEAEDYIPVFEVNRQGYKVHKTKEGYTIIKSASTGKVLEFDTFKTEQEAKDYLNSTEGATSLLNRKREDFSIPSLETIERTGKDYRKGKDVTTDEFMNAFGFRGGEFGNWVKPEERRVLLNTAYDSLMDLSEILGISPRAISLNGNLSIAFGARGSKGASAHYESDRAVINLTRLNGAGSMAHEWAHALDNYFGLQEAKKDYSRNEKGELISKRYMKTEEKSYQAGMRKELAKIFEQIVENTTEKQVTRKMGLEEKQSVFDKFQKAVQREVNNAISVFENGKRKRAYNRKTKQYDDVLVKATPDQLERVKELTETIVSGNSGKFDWKAVTSNMLGDYAYVNPEMQELETMFKNIFGYSGLKRDGLGIYNLGYYGNKLNDAKEQLDKAVSGHDETLKVKTDFFEQSKKFDAMRAQPYWTKKVELFARAFEGFINEKLNERGIKSDYLQYDKAPVYDDVFGMNPYPQGEELTELTRLFKDFFDTIQEGENGSLFQTTDKTIEPSTEKEQADLTAHLLSTGLAKEVRMVTPEEMSGILDGTEQQHAVYHGSPHSFDQFDLDHIGTGEGAQAYGHGLYFTDKKGIAEDYAKKLAGKYGTTTGEPLTQIQNRELDTFLSLSPESDLKDFGKAMDYKLAVTKSWIAEGDNVESNSKWVNDIEGLIKKINNNEVILKSNRNLYSVELHEGKNPNEYDYLRWDKAITDEQVQKFENYWINKYGGLESLDNRIEGVLFRKDHGEDLYFRLQDYLGSKKAASDFLLSAGIDGIKYPSNFTTGKSNETDFNYVVFDPSAITIKEKVQFMRKPNGEVYGFVKNGIVYLNSTKPNLNTPIHEFGHLYTPIIKTEHPEFYQKGISLIKESPYYEDVKSDPNYSHLDEDGIIDEAMNQAIGDKGAKTVQNIGLFARLKEWIRGVWERIGAKFGIKNLTSEQIQDLTLNDWTDIVNSELLNGEKLTTKPLKSEITEAQKTNNQELIDKAAKHFGTTDNFKVAGYLTTDGKLLDFSGIHYGGGSANDYRSRGVDHRDISEIENTDIIDFMSYGNIRLKPETDGFEITQKPTPEQFTMLKKYIRSMKQGALVDVSNPNGKEEFSFEYPKNTNPERIINDIKRYFDDGIKPIDNGMRFQIIGEKGANNLEKAEEATTRLDNLRVAKEMEATKTPIEIRLATGWERNTADNLWRYEISDGKFKDTWENATTLDEAWNDEQLFKAYPHLKDIQIGALSSEESENSGTYFPKGVDDKPTIYAVGKDIYGLKSVFIHEIQHAIQDYEGFASGGLPSQFERNFNKDQRMLKEYSDASNKYTKTGEGKAALAERDAIFEDKIVGKITKDEMDEKISDLSLKYPGFNQFKFNNSMVERIRKAMSLSPEEQYRKLAGETEARNVQARMNLTPEERQQRLLSETADVAPEDQIVIMDGMGVSMMTEKPQAPEILPEDNNIDIIKKKRDHYRALEEWAKENAPYIQIPQPTDYPTSEEYSKARKDFVDMIHQVNLEEPVSKKPEEPKKEQSALTFIPGVTEVSEFTKKAYEQFTSTFIPYKIGKDGVLSKEVMTENLASLARRQDIAEATMKEMSKKFDKMSKLDSLDFIDKMEKGLPQPTEELQAYADVLRKTLDNAKENVQALGTGKLDTYIENYFPHMWGDAKKAGKILGKKPLEGTKGWMRQRTIEFTVDGVNRGLVPVSWNPVRLTMLKVRDMERYVMAHETINELKKAGLVKFVSIGYGVPEGFEKIDDKIGTIQKFNEDKTITILGNYYAAENAARVINNYVSKGLWGNVVYDTFRGLTNTMTQVQLGLSAFHLGFTTLDATISKAANGIDHLFQLNIKDALKEFIQVPLAPIINPIKGDKLLKAWYGKPSTPEMEQIAKYMELAGGRVQMDKFYANNYYERILENVKNRKYLTAGIQVPLSIVEWAAKPILEYIVPRQKLGVFADMSREIIKNHPDYTPEELRKALQSAWSSVDNRLGQLVYDNLYWNKLVKDISMASVRAVGWNLGSIREIGGAPKQAGEFLWNTLRGKKTAETHKLSYVMALIATHMIVSSILQYLLTGKGPDELEDYFFPKRGGFDTKGDPKRVSLPSYWKDIYAYSKEPGKTVANKLSPVFGMISQLVNNKDYYGVKIINSDDEPYQKGLDYLKYFGAQFVPFGIRNVQKETSKEPIDYVLPFIGITPAPYSLSMTPAEKTAFEIASSKYDVGGRTQDEKDQSDVKKKLRDELRSNGGDLTPLKQALNAGAINASEFKKLKEDYNQSSFDKMIKSFTYRELFQIYKEGNEVERKKVYPLLIQKVETKKYDTTLTDKEKAKLNEISDFAKETRPFTGDKTADEYIADYKAKNTAVEEYKKKRVLGETEKVPELEKLNNKLYDSFGKFPSTHADIEELLKSIKTEKEKTEPDIEKINHKEQQLIKLIKQLP